MSLLIQFLSCFSLHALQELGVYVKFCKLVMAFFGRAFF